MSSFKQFLLEAGAKSGEAHYVPKGNGGMGEMLVLDDSNPMIAAIAKALKLSKDWELTAVGPGLWAAYNGGDRLSFFTNKTDFADE